MPEAVDVSIKEPSRGYQLRVVQEVLLALLAKEPSHGYQLRARLQLALGPLADAMNAGQVYVTLNRLEKAGLVTSERVGQTDRPDRKVYELTKAGHERVVEWLGDTSWPDWPTPYGWRTRSGTPCWKDWPRPSAPPWPSRTVRSPDCCSRAWC
jgi:DNA-binding PadR family transcriptional regulator